MTSDKKRDNFIIFSWSLPVIAILLTLIYSFSFKPWSWGLMDDLQILSLKGNVFERAWSYFQGFLSFGEFKFIWALHCAIFYKIFENAPKLFYIFKLFEICLILFIWGLAVFRITRQKISIVLVSAITLSFHYFYDAFFYLSSHEYLGLFFVGLALHCLLNSLDPVLDFEQTKEQGFRCLQWFFCLLFLFLSYGCKETFVACGIAFGLTLIALSWMKRKTVHFKPLFFAGIVLVLFTFSYAFILMTFVKSSHTSGYSFTNFPKIWGNVQAWFKKDFLNHFPWLIATILILWKNKASGKKMFEADMRFLVGLLLSVLLYVGFLLVLLPWNPIIYFATPLGLFFAFIITLLISQSLPPMGMRMNIFFVLCALTFNQVVFQYALARESTYQKDTIHLMEWIEHHEPFQTKGSDISVFSNAMEAAFAIPGHINRKTDLDLEEFHWTTQPDLKQDGKRCQFYLYSPRFHGINVNALKGWEVVFVSKNWILYQRPKEK